MASWLKPVRIGVAIFGLASAGAVYFAMSDRRTAAPPAAVTRSDPKAILETIGSVYERVTGLTQNFKIEGGRSDTYPDGSMKWTGPLTITIHRDNGRTFKITAHEASAKGKDAADIELSGDVRVEDSEGFVLTTDQATYNQPDSIARAAGAVSFSKGRMSGSGTSMSYDEKRNVLIIGQQAQVTTTDAAGKPSMQFTSASATLDRAQHTLNLEGAVHALRNQQVIDTDHANAQLSEDNEVITYIALRGNARVSGGSSSIDAMSARDINLDYTDDGAVLERVEMSGGGAIAMTGQAGQNGRQILGNGLELTLAPDGSVTKAVGGGNVRLDLPASATTPLRSITAQALDATGKQGVGLTNATFTDAVTFTEQPLRTPSAAAPKAGTRTARAQKLDAALMNDAVTAATFTGDVSFEEPGLKACSARLDYQPLKNTLALTGPTPAGNPIVAQEQVTIEGQAIDVALDTRRMAAKGMVRTLMRSPGRCKPSVARAASEQGVTRMPGLLKDNAAATITAETLDYRGDAGIAVYIGGKDHASLSQGDTTIYADRLEIDQGKGDLLAVGNAVSNMTLDGDTSTGRAYEIRYVDDKRLLRYSAPPPGLVLVTQAPTARGPVPATTRFPYISSGSGTSLQLIQADTRIEILLARDSSAVSKITADDNVRMSQGTRRVTGGARLVYDPNDEGGKYIVTAAQATGGATPMPVTLLADCREFTGKTLTFFKADDRLSVDGRQEIRTATNKSATPCAQGSGTR